MGDGGRGLGRRGGRVRDPERNRRTAASTSRCTIAWASAAATVSSTWRADRGWRSNWRGIRGAGCAGIDASPRLVAVAQDRNPDGDIRVGDMEDLPWARRDASTSLPASVASGARHRPPSTEAHRVLVPGGRLAITVWGNVGKSPGAWMLAPLPGRPTRRSGIRPTWSSLGRPGVGEAFLGRRAASTSTSGSRSRSSSSFPTRRPSPAALASTGPAYEAIQSIGEDEFVDRATSSPRNTCARACRCAARSSCSATSAPSADHSRSPRRRPGGRRGGRRGRGCRRRRRGRSSTCRRRRNVAPRK